MKILHVIDSINSKMGGPAQSVTALASAQAELGHKVSLACRNFSHLGQQVVASGVRIESVLGGRWAKGWGCFGQQFKQVILQAVQDVDVVHSHGLWTAAGVYVREAVQAMRSSEGRPCWVVSPRGMLTPWALRRSTWKKRIAWHLFEKKNLKSADLLHATAVTEAEDIRKSTFVNAIPRWVDFGVTPVVVVPNGVDVPDKLPERSILEKEFPELMEKKWVLFMSRLHPKKGLLELAKAWRKVRADHPNHVLIIAGSEENKEYVRQVKKILVDEGVWMGQLDGPKKWSALANSEFLILPTYSENFGLVVAESLAAGRPVITTTGTPWGEAAKLRGNGRLFPSDLPPPTLSSRPAQECLSADLEEFELEHGEDMNIERNRCGLICEVDSCQEALQRMLGFSTSQRDEMGSRGREWIKRGFNWLGLAKRMVEAYQIHKKLIHKSSKT